MPFSPLEQFSILNIIPFNFFFLDFSLSSISVYCLIHIAIIITFLFFTKEKDYSLFHPWVYIFNSLFRLILNLIIDNIGLVGLNYFNIILSLFCLLLIFNYSSLIPYSFTLTAHLGVCLTLSFTIWLGSTILGFYLNGLNFISMFLPYNTHNILAIPFILIESLGYCVRPISLGVRLAANLAAGHLLLALGSSFIYFLFSNNLILIKLTAFLPFLLLIIFSYLEFAVSFIQAYVFSLLAITYINDSINLH